jgi:hypothetical protein
MGTMIRVHTRQILVPSNPEDVDIFVGKWVKAQDKAVEKAIWLTNNDIKGYIFDNIVDQLTVKYYVEDNQ